MAEARIRADRDWETDAVIFRNVSPMLIDDVFVEINVDQATGLMLRRRVTSGEPQSAFTDTYNQRVLEMFRLHGAPKYSLGSHIPSASEIAKTLDAADLTAVKRFPTEVAPDIYLMRRGKLTRWGSTSTSNSDGLCIVTRKGGSLTIGNDVLPVHVKQSGKVFYIRNGRKWIGVFYSDGRMIASAWRR